MREVAVLFDMAESTHFAITDRVLDFLCEIAPDIIHFGLDKEALARDFQEVSSYIALYYFNVHSYIMSGNNKVCVKKQSFELHFLFTKLKTI